MILDGQELAGLREDQLTRLRRDRVGFILQSFNLLGALTVQQNVILPLQLAGTTPDKASVARVIEQVGLTGRRRHRPRQLSGGQQQRLAIARALITRPAVIFADEPTGALDTHTAGEVLTLLRDAVRTAGQTVVIVTHDPTAASYADRVVSLADGQLADELDQPTAEVVADRLTQLGSWADGSRRLVPARRL